jgi:hypothetical protein
MKMKKQLVWPNFYIVDPSDVRNLKNSYGKAMTEHENKFGNDYEKIQNGGQLCFKLLICLDCDTLQGMFYNVYIHINNSVKKLILKQNKC